MLPKLSKKNINIIRNSASLVTRNAPDITTRMYEIMFSEYPHIKPLFADAPLNQHMKLADALSAYAINIDKLHIFTPALMVIAQKHVEINIKAGHYPIVGNSLIQAMKETITKADDDFFEAWKEAYNYLADILIDMEEKIYRELSASSS